MEWGGDEKTRHGSCTLDTSSGCCMASYIMEKVMVVRLSMDVFGISEKMPTKDEHVLFEHN